MKNDIMGYAIAYFADVVGEAEVTEDVKNWWKHAVEWSSLLEGARSAPEILHERIAICLPDWRRAIVAQASWIPHRDNASTVAWTAKVILELENLQSACRLATAEAR